MIDYRKIADAVDYYTGLGYKYIEVPWLVKKKTTQITKPEWCRNFETYLGCLVASGEQSLLEMRDTLKPDSKYICVTPCFRDEKEINNLTQNWFMKAELIVVNPSDWDSMLWCRIGVFKLNSLRQMLNEAANFIKRYTYNYTYCMSIPSEVDIRVNNIEIGSYGYREHNGFRWVYGTACAEPRLSEALKK